MRHVLLLVSLAAGPASAQTSPQPHPDDTVRVLFVGNSLTQANDLPAMVAALARASGVTWDVHSAVIMGASLADHLEEGTAGRLLRDTRWDFVVLQQGPSTLPASRANLRAGARAFLPLIERAGARPALYMVWPDSTWSGPRFEADFDRIRDAYALAAGDVGGLFLPAGEAWRAARRADPALPLYGPDGFHPAPEGTWVAALAIFGELSARPLEGLPARLTHPDGTVLVNIPAARAAPLQRAVVEALISARRASPDPGGS